MHIGEKGENLIFLISTPRSGSTLLQQMLGGNPEVHTLPEPWIALPSLYTLYSRNIDRRHNTEYNLYWARTAVKGFIEHLPGGEETYLSGIRKMYAHLYGSALEGTGKKIFLDKGPRYFLIIPELYKVFPEAKYIILFRNPLAFLVSIFNRWGKGRYEVFSGFKPDLLEGGRRLIAGTSLLNGRAAVIKYEELLDDTEKSLKDICGATGLRYDPVMMKYERKQKFDSSLGYQEQKEEYWSGAADSRNADKWALSLRDPQLWRAADDYLRFLGSKLVEGMGYSYDGMKQVLAEHYPGRLKLLGTRSLFQIIRKGETEYMRKGMK